MEKTYKGFIHSLFPEAGNRFGYITPPWSDRDNLFFHFSETKKGCRILALKDKDNLCTVSKNKNGRNMYRPKQPQIVYFNISVRNNNLVAINLKDDQHVSSEEILDAAENLTKPTIEEILNPTIAQVELVASVKTIKPETLKTLKEASESAALDMKGPAIDAWFASQPKPEKEEVRAKKKRPNPKAVVSEEDDEKPFGCDGAFSLSYNVRRQSLAIIDNSKDEEEFIEPVEEVEDVDYNEYDEYDDLYEVDENFHKMRANDDK